MVDKKALLISPIVWLAILGHPDINEEGDHVLEKEM